MERPTGHGFAVFNGDLLQDTGAILGVRYLWDTSNVAFVEDYTRPFLGYAANDNIKGKDIINVAA